MQELIDFLKELQETQDPYTFNDAIEFAEATLEKEKEVMCEFAYKCHKRHKVHGDFMIQDYYNETFNTK